MNNSAMHRVGWQSQFRLLIGSVLVLWLASTSSAPAWAQAAAAKKKRFEDITLHTEDGVILRCTYYPAQPSKQTVPVILLHDWNGNRAQFHQLALYLQRKKITVIVPDLRGHGQSTFRMLPGGRSPLKIDRTKMKKAAVESTVLDVEAVKKFLLEKNNKGELNIEQLCVVGCGFGSIVALNWAMVDWNKRSLPAYKIGKDVKALVLVSPLQSFRGVTTRMALAHPVVRKGLAVLVIVGANNSQYYSEAKRVFKSFERFHGKKAQDIGFLEFDTSLEGTQLINARGLGVGGKIAQFIDWILVRNAARYPWHDRTNPLDQ